MQGCGLRCLYCHNPDTWARGGESITPEALVKEVMAYRTYLTGGVTFSGGEPLLQASFLAEACLQLHSLGIHTAIDTSGGLSISGAILKAISIADLILLDIKSADPEQCAALTGQSNENAFLLLDHCERLNKSVWIRQVQVPGFTLERAQLELLRKRLNPYSCIEKVELLPYHDMARHKYDAMGLHYPLDSIEPTTPAQMEQAWAWFNGKGA